MGGHKAGSLLAVIDNPNRAYSGTIASRRFQFPVDHVLCSVNRGQYFQDFVRSGNLKEPVYQKMGRLLAEARCLKEPRLGPADRVRL